jgi:light-regulated signal transduction histidine kinase (bacteriophytochrome)
LPRRVAAPKRGEGARQAPAILTTPFPSNGDAAEIALASASSFPTPSEAIGHQTLAAISSALAHEVRGPLRWVTSFSELLVQEAGTSLNQTGKDYLQRISGAAARLDQVMRDLQKFVAAGIQEPRQQVVSLESALCAVLGSLASEISAKRAQVTLLRPLPPLKGDTDWVQQCLVRLIDNALKFVSPGVSPLVRVWSEARPGVVRLASRSRSHSLALRI